MADVLCFGEAVIDFICAEKETTIIDGTTFMKKAGGAPANVAAGISRLGASSGFVGKVGNEKFGRFLQKTLEENNVDTSTMVLDPNANTMLAFVSLQAGGVPDFTLYRNPGAHTLLRSDEVDMNKIRGAKIFHYGSISLAEDPTRETHVGILNALRGETFLSYDPNLRLALWRNENHAREGTIEGLPYADLVKVSEEELAFITGKTNINGGIETLHSYGPSTVFVTRGKEGVIASNKTDTIVVPGRKVQAIDTTGAGDGFVAGALYKIVSLADPRQELQHKSTLEQIAQFANVVGALTTTKYGAIDALPTLQEVTRYLAIVKDISLSLNSRRQIEEF